MVFDDDMRASARVLAKHSLMGGSFTHGDFGGDSEWGGRGGTGLQGMGSLGQSLVSCWRCGADVMQSSAGAEATHVINFCIPYN